jgi:hypothetical protein
MKKPRRGNKLTITYIAKNGETFDLNHAGNRWLDRVTLGLWDKIGVPARVSAGDRLLIARMIRNREKLARFKTGNPEHQIDKILDPQDGENPESAETFAEFLERSGGLICEDDEPDGA